MQETIDTGFGKTINRSSDKAIKAFVEQIALACPHFMGADKAHFSPSLDPRTLLARAIEAVDYAPSTLAILADQKALIRKGFLVDADIPQLSLRNMTEHCTKPMLDELAGAIKAHEESLVELLVEPVPKAEVDEPAAAVRETAIVNDEMLGRIEIDVATAEIVRMVSDNDAMGDVLVDEAGQVMVSLDTETAKQSKVWGSW